MKYWVSRKEINKYLPRTWQGRDAWTFLGTPRNTREAYKPGEIRTLLGELGTIVARTIRLVPDLGIPFSIYPGEHDRLEGSLSLPRYVLDHLVPWLSANLRQWE